MDHIGVTVPYAGLTVFKPVLKNWKGHFRYCGFGKHKKLEDFWSSLFIMSTDGTRNSRCSPPSSSLTERLSDTNNKPGNSYSACQHVSVTALLYIWETESKIFRHWATLSFMPGRKRQNGTVTDLVSVPTPTMRWLVSVSQRRRSRAAPGGSWWLGTLGLAEWELLVLRLLNAQTNIVAGFHC